MSMLAEPRRKQKVINLRAKNSAWSNDANKFGQRMLEKMGWSSGKGLGAKENGIVEHVVAKYKNDDRGLGYEDKNDQWTKHEDDFNTLLANLSNGPTSDEKLHSGISLEDKSKKSKARVHYHKFTRGKDLTKYSEKDLANIFGKRSFKNKENPKEIIQDDDLKTTEQVFTEKGSMEDYFKNKLANFKSKNKFKCIKQNEDEDCENDYGFKGFSGTTDEFEPEIHQGFGFQSTLMDSNETVSPETEKLDVNFENTKKSKKKKKTNDKELLIENNITDAAIVSQDQINNENNSNHEEENTKMNKKKSKKQKSENKKNKKKKHKSDSESEIIDANKTMEESENVEDYHVPKKKKKRK